MAGEPRLRRAEGDGWKLTEAGATAIDGELPVNCSGGVLSSNPIGASGMLRFAEAALQVRGAAGEHQVDGARKALGHAYGGGSQFFAMWVVGAEKPTQLAAVRVEAERVPVRVVEHPDVVLRLELGQHRAVLHGVRRGLGEV